MNQLKYPARRNRNRRASAQATRRVRSDMTPVSVTFTTPYVDVTFGQKIVLAGIPQYATSTGVLPTAAVTADLMTVRLTYPTPGLATSIIVPAGDPAIHNQTGGGVAAGTYTFPD